MLVLVSKFKIIRCRNAIEHCAPSGPKKLTKTYNKEFSQLHNHSTLLIMILWIHPGYLVDISWAYVVGENDIQVNMISTQSLFSICFAS